MMVQEKCDLYKLEIYGLNQTSYSNNLLVELKQYLRNDLKLKFSNLEYNPQSQATVIFFQYKGDYDSARNVFSKRVQWRTFQFGVDAKPMEKSPTCDKKPAAALSSPTSGEEKKQQLDLSMSTTAVANGTKEQMSQKLEEYIQTNYPLLSVPYETQLKGKQEHVLSTYANLFKQYINFKQLLTFQTFMRTKYGDSRPFMFGGVLPAPSPDKDGEERERNMLELNVGTDVETGAISVGFPINDDPNLKTPCQVIPLRDVARRHCFNIPQKFITATEIIEKIIQTSGLQTSSNMNNSMGVWHKIMYRMHSKITGAGTLNEKVTPQLMIVFHIRPGYKLTPEIIDYISDIILDEVLRQNTVQCLGLASVYIQRDHPISFQDRTDSDEYLKIIEDHWKYLPEWLRLWGADYLEDSGMHLKILPHTRCPPSVHQYNASVLALRDLLVDVTDTYTIVDINCSTGILGGSLIHKCKQLKFVTFNVLTQSTIESHLELLTASSSTSSTSSSSSSSSAKVAQWDISRYKSSRTHYDTLSCDHSDDGQCIHCAIHRVAGSVNGAGGNGGVSNDTTDKTAAASSLVPPLPGLPTSALDGRGSSPVSSNHVKPINTISTEQKIEIVKKVLTEVTGEKVVVIYHYNSGDDFCDDFFKLIQYNTKIEKVLFVTDSAHNLNSNLVVQCIPYVMTHVSCMDAQPHSHLYDVMILFERLEPNVSHDQVQLGFKFNDKVKLIEQARAEEARAQHEKQETLARLKAEAAAAKLAAPAKAPTPPAEVKVEPGSGTPVGGVTPVGQQVNSNHYVKDERYPPRQQTHPSHPQQSHPTPPPSSSFGLPPPAARLSTHRYPPYGPPAPPSPFTPRALPPPPSYHGQQPRQQFGPPEVYNNQYSTPPAARHMLNTGHPSYHHADPKARSSGSHHFPNNNHHSSNNARPNESRYQHHEEPSPAHKRKPSTNEIDRASSINEQDRKRAKMDTYGGTNTTYQHQQGRFDHSASSSPGVSSNSHPSSVSPQVSNSSSYGGGGGGASGGGGREGSSAGGGSGRGDVPGGNTFSHSSATQTGFQPYAKPGGGGSGSNPSTPGTHSPHQPPQSPSMGGGGRYAFPPPPPAHSNTPHSISDLTQKRPDGVKDSRRYPPPPSPKSSPSPLYSSYPPPPLPPPRPSSAKHSPKPPLPSEPPPSNQKDSRDTKDKHQESGGGGGGGSSMTNKTSAADHMAQLHMAALSGKDPQHPVSSMHPSVPYGQLSQAEVMKLYEAQMAAYMPGASSQEISHLYAMQLAEAQMLQAAQAAQISSAQKLYAAQVASIEEQQKQYALQVQAAQQAHHAAAKLQNEKAAMEAQMMREAQIKAHHQHQAKLSQQAAQQAQLNQQQAAAQAAHNSSVGALQAPQATYPMSDAAKLQHNAQVQMMNDAAQHQKLQHQQMQQAAQQQQMQAADIRKLYEDQFMYDLMHQQALALGYPPQGYGSPRGVPHSALMHPLYSTQMLYAQGPPPPGSAPGMLPYESLPQSRPR